MVIYQPTISGSLTITGSVITTSGFTGSLQGTSSFATTASYALGAVGGSGTSGNIAKFTGTSTIGNATADADYLINDLGVVAYQAMGSTIKGIGLSIRQPHNIITLVSLPTSSITFVPYYLPQTTTITGVKWWQGTLSVGSTGSFGLYSVSASTLLLQASASNDTTLFTTSQNTFKNKAFSNTYSATAGIYYISILTVSGSSPILGAIASATNPGFYTSDLTNSHKIAATTASTSLPLTQSLSSLNTSQQSFGLFLY